MKKKSTIKFNLEDSERKILRSKKVRIADIPNYAADELEVLLDVSKERAKELFALIEFQKIPSIGIRFAEDLVFLGYHNIEEFIGKDGAKLFDEYEQKKGYWVDACVEDQFRLIVYFANTGDFSKKWWDFTTERKEHRSKNGYPARRPTIAWHKS